MRGASAISGMLLASALVGAEESPSTHNHHQMETPSGNNWPIRITINPEARVSVVMAGALPAPVTCGESTVIPIKIVNHGFVTAPLEVALVGDVPEGVTLDFSPQRLTGVSEELRELRITLTKPGVTDLTVAFKARHESPDLGGRDRVHFLLHCVKATEGSHVGSNASSPES